MDNDLPLFSLMVKLWNTPAGGVFIPFFAGNWVHGLAGASYRAYLTSRPSRLRNTIKRRTRHFLDSNRGHLNLILGGDSLEAGITDYVTIYKRSWKQEEPFPDFIPRLLRLSANRGWLRLGIARYDNKPVASQIWLISHGTAYIFKLAYDEDFKHLSPGTVLTAFMMEQIIDKDGITQIDYLSGDDDYKRDWMSLRRERQGIAAYNPLTIRGAGMLVGRALRTLFKQSRPTTTGGSRL
ncbi:MAG: GNAT family N-acetyltransferase [Halioglobus sp.]